jgi:ZIP family zinc transporter
VPPELLLALPIAVAATASPRGGLLVLWLRPATLAMSAILGFTSGVLLATLSFEMLPSALEYSSVTLTIAGFLAGLAVVYAFDMAVHRGVLVGEKAEQRRWLRVRSAPEKEITVLAAGTSMEELIEGVTIGVGLAIKPELGLLVALAIAIDNISEALSIGELIRSENAKKGRSEAARILGWTGLIGLSLLVSSLVGWFFLQGLPHAVLGLLFAVGAGGLFYLTVTDLVPEAEKRQYQQLPAITMGAGFMLVFALSTYT